MIEDVHFGKIEASRWHWQDLDYGILAGLGCLQAMVSYLCF
jgi:hypothetical protein